MSNQAADKVRFQGEDHELAGLAGGTLFHPKSVGIETSGYSTATYRGFVSFYAVNDDRLQLVQLLVHAASKPPAFGGVEPNSLFAGIWKYEALAYPWYLDGRILLVRNFVDGWYRGVVPEPWVYGQVFELEFNRGLLIKSKDFSNTMPYIREELQKYNSTHPIGSITPEEFEEMIKLGWSFAPHYQQQPDIFGH